jgi:hypothetical protein
LARVASVARRERGTLLRRKFDVANPQADGASGDAETAFDLSHEEAIAPELPRHASFSRFHF